MLSNKIIRVLNFFDCFGYNSGSSRLLKYPKITCFISVVHISFATLFTFYKIHLTIMLLSSVRLVEVINDAMQLSLGIYTYWAIIFDSIRQKRKHQHFWRILAHINSSYCNGNEIQIQRFLRTFKAYMLIVDTIFFINYASNGFSGTIDYAIYLALNTICQVRIFYYIFCLEVVCFQLKIIEEKLKEINILELKDRWHYLERIRKHYAKVYEMCINLNEIFGWSHVAITLYCFYKLLTELNWFYTSFHGEYRIINNSKLSLTKRSHPWAFDFHNELIEKLQNLNLFTKSFQLQ